MSGFMRTVSTLGQNIFACLPAIADREAHAVLQKWGGAPSWRVVVESLGTWLLAGTKGKAQQLSPGGWGGSQREAFCLAKLLIFFVGQPLSVMPCRLSGWKPASQSQASWVSKLCVVRLPVADRLKNPRNFLENCQGGCAEVSTVFINLDIYILDLFAPPWTVCSTGSIAWFHTVRDLVRVYKWWD